MKVCGLSSRTRSRPRRPSAIRLRNFFCHGPKSCASAMMSAAMKPTLWRWSAYLRARIAKADPELHRQPLAWAPAKKKPPASVKASGS